MPNLNDLYPSKYLVAGDIPDEGMVVTIRSMDMQKMRDGTEKLTLYFDETEKGLVCNKTNAKTIAKLYGDDTDDWEDGRITLFPSETDFGGETVPCIRVRPKKPRPTTPPNGAPKPSVAKSGKPISTRKPGEDDEEDDEIPF